MPLLGAAQLRANLLAIAGAIPQTVAASLVAEADAILPVAKSRTPRSPGGGALRNSGKRHEPEINGPDISVTITFGDATTEAYAVAVHEHLSPSSPPSWQTGKPINWTEANTGPKFLEQPVLEARAGMAERHAKRLLPALETKG
jgi:hypothetical protein